MSAVVPSAAISTRASRHGRHRAEDFPAFNEEHADRYSAPAVHAERSDPTPPDETKPLRATKSSRKHKWRRRFFVLFLLVVIAMIVGRIMLPRIVQAYVNRTLDRNPLYDGRIGEVDIRLWRGAYSIRDIKLDKTTGNVPVPLFAAERVDLAVEWKQILNRTIVGTITIERPELNFVAGEDESDGQSTGGGGPWLGIIRDLFPFTINSATIHDGTVRFSAFHTSPPVELELTELEATIDDLSNVNDAVTPLVSTIKVTALAMGQANTTLDVKLDPFSYKPTFTMALKLIGLDVTKTNSFARAYGQFDFEYGFFDLVTEIESTEGSIDGYVKPLFRNLKVFSLRKDVPEDNVLGVFWEALVGTASELLENQPRDQLGTVIPLRGNVSGPEADVMTTIGNVLRNAFIRAYMPRLQGMGDTGGAIEFGPGTVSADDATTPVGKDDDKRSSSDDTSENGNSK